MHINYFKAQMNLDAQAVREAYEAQKEMKWTFFDERLHMESLFSQRMNFLLLVFPVLVAAFFSVNADEWVNKLCIAGTGLIIMLVFYLLLKRTFFKLDILQQITYKIPAGNSDKYNPMMFTHNLFLGIHRCKKLREFSSYSIAMYGIVFMLCVMSALTIGSAVELIVRAF